MLISPQPLPVWQNADIIVLGSTIAAVSAALSAKAARRRVVVLGDEAFFGSDFVGDLHLWEKESADPLIREVMAGEFPAKPAAIKRALEHRLLKAGIPFLYGMRPVGELADESGRAHGVVAAARTSLLAVLGPQIIDATPFGLAARLASLPLVKRQSDRIAWRVLAAHAPSNWPGQVSELSSPYRQVLKEEMKEFAAFELGISRSELNSDSKKIAHLLRAALVDESVWFAASHRIDPGDDVLASCRLGESLAALQDSDLQAAPGLWMANRLLAVRELAGLTDPSQMSALGRHVGELAASCPSPPSPEAFCFRSGDRPSERPFSFTKAFLRNPQGEIAIDALSFPIWDGYDVLVAGGGTGGAPAAIAAARTGARTLCLESAHGLGGVGTLGLICSYWFGNKVGFTAELNEAVSEVDSLSRSKHANSWRPEIKSAIYHRLLNEAGGSAWQGSFAFGVRLAGQRPDGLLVSTPFGCGFVPAKTIVDATGNADVAAASGAACRMIDAHHVAVQGTGISPRKDPSIPHQNSDHTFVEENDPEGLTAAHLQAREKYPDDFETAPFVNSRERRQIVGDIELSPIDILAGRTFPDTIFTAKSNFDTHGFIIHPVFMVAPPDHSPLQAHVPLRCMLPKGLKGILVTGLGMSAHRDALPVIRMQADVQNQGYAAGLLAAQCASSGEDFRAVDVRAFQQELVAKGIITAETAQHEDSFPLSIADVQEAIHGDLSAVKNVAIVFAHAEKSQEGLRRVMESDPNPSSQLQAALILGLMGDPLAAGPLENFLSGAAWDEGWNYRGMGQFGASMSLMDARIIALGRCGGPTSAHVLIPLVNQLEATSAFSHCRAVALAAAAFKSSDLTSALARLLDLPTLTGNSFQTTEDMLSDSDGDTTSTQFRNLALRELYVARGVYLGGDFNDRGRSILETYTRDLRGHFARHAMAVLESDSSLHCSLDLA